LARKSISNLILLWKKNQTFGATEDMPWFQQIENSGFRTYFAWVLPFLCALGGCQKRFSIATSELSSLTVQSNGADSRTACIALQNNGTYFSAHIGSYIALMEQNIIPVVTSAGGSASLVGAAVMSLLQNKSLQQEMLFEGNVLTPTQKAALLLASSQDIWDSLLFLPSLNKSNEPLTSTLRLLSGISYFELPSQPTLSHILNLDIVIGQSLLIADFLKNSDFSNILGQENFAARRKAMRKLWIQETDGFEADTGEILATLIKRTSDRSAPPRSTEISKRLLALLFEKGDSAFLQDRHDFYASSEAMLASWGFTSFEKTAQQVYELAQKLHMSDTQSQENFLARKIILPSPELIRRFASGIDARGNLISLPPGLVIHSTFKSLRQKQSRIEERLGWDSIYQGYFASTSLFSGLVKVRDAARNMRNSGFIPLLKNEHKFLKDTDHVIVFPESDKGEKLRGLAFAMQATLSEPGPFRRNSLAIDGRDTSFNPGMPTELATSGGWLEHIPSSIFESLSPCQSSNLLAWSGNPNPVSPYTKRILAGALAGGTAYVDPKQPPLRKDLDQFANRLAAASLYSMEMKGKEGHVETAVDWENISKVENPDQHKRMSKIIGNHRTFLMIHAYQRTRKSMLKHALGNREIYFKETKPWGILFKRDLDSALDENQLQEIISQ
jgi:hypothetical protein